MLGANVLVAETLGFFRGAFAEYACSAEDEVVPKPANLTFEQAGLDLQLFVLFDVLLQDTCCSAWLIKAPRNGSHALQGLHQ